MNINPDDILLDFARRTKMNLEYIEEKVKSEPNNELFEVTQLVNSLLGLLVFPFEKYRRKIPDKSLKQLEEMGWIAPRIIGSFPQVPNLHTLIRYLRNAVSHFNIKFVADKNNVIDGVHVWNEYEKKTTWKAEMKIHELRNNVYKFIEIIEEAYNK